MKRAVAMLLVLSFSLFGCFPHDAHKRTIAKLAEGGAIVAGVALEAVINSGADCDQMSGVGGLNGGDSCHTKAAVLGDLGVALMLGGLLGFVATISTAEEERPKPVEIKAADAPAEKPALSLPPGVQAQPKSADAAAAAAPAAVPAQ